MTLQITQTRVDPVITEIIRNGLYAPQTPDYARVTSTSRPGPQIQFGLKGAPIPNLAAGDPGPTPLPTPTPTPTVSPYPSPTTPGYMH